MEEEELLRIIKIFLAGISIVSSLNLGSYSYAATSNVVVETKVEGNSASIIDRAISLATDAKRSIYEQSKDIIQKFLVSSPASNTEISEESILDTRPKLLIFVSISMPESLLQNYYREASKYGGTLVFKGLPNGSFKELTALITRLHEGKNSGRVGSYNNNTKYPEEAFAGAVIDDESFSRFGIFSVPAIVLADEQECFEQQSCNITYDRVTGNIGIRAALEAFKNNGDMKVAARDMLQDNSTPKEKR